MECQELPSQESKEMTSTVRDLTTQLGYYNQAVDVVVKIGKNRYKTVRSVECRTIKDHKDPRKRIAPIVIELGPKPKYL